MILTSFSLFFLSLSSHHHHCHLHYYHHHHLLFESSCNNNPFLRKMRRKKRRWRTRNRLSALLHCCIYDYNPYINVRPWMRTWVYICLNVCTYIPMQLRILIRAYVDLYAKTCTKQLPAWQPRRVKQPGLPHKTWLSHCPRIRVSRSHTRSLNDCLRRGLGGEAIAFRPPGLIKATRPWGLGLGVRSFVCVWI